ncbi:MAG: hypothetical protein WAN23_11960 [Candidatus Acidiferrales bacterium]
MPISATKRGLIALAALVCLVAAAAGVYLYRARRPLPAAAPSTRPVPGVFSELPPDAPGVAYLDVAALRKLQGSPLAAMLGLAGANPQSDRDYAEFVRGTGFDYTRDLDKAAIAFWPASHIREEGIFDRAVAIAEGRFDQPKIKAYALRTGHVVMHGSDAIYEVPGNPPTAFEFLSPARIILASGKNPARLLGPFNPRPRDPAIQALTDRVAAAPIFAVARTDNLPAAFYDNFRSSPQLEQLARNIQGLTLVGQPKADDLQLALDAECDSMAHAIEMSTLLEGFRMIGSMALADPKTRREMSRDEVALLNALLSQAKLTHQDRWVRLSLDVTPTMLGSKSAADPKP